MSDEPAPPPTDSGSPPQGPPPYWAPYGYAAQTLAPQPSNGIGVAGGVCGIIAVVLCWIPFVDYISVVLGTLAIIFGALGVRHANASGGAGKGMAVTGIVCGIVGLAISLIFLLLIYAVISTVTVAGGI